MPTDRALRHCNDRERFPFRIRLIASASRFCCSSYSAFALSSSVFNGQSALFITQSEKMFRAQKRKSVRCECHVPAQMYIIREKIINFSTVETAPGLRCILEDISEDGAMIRIGGKAVGLQLPTRSGRRPSPL